jgi:hypothetical protein
MYSCSAAASASVLRIWTRWKSSSLRCPKKFSTTVCEIFPLAGSDRLFTERLRPKMGRSRDRGRIAICGMLQGTPSLHARHYEKQLRWQEMMVPEITRRLGASPDQPEDPRPNALVAAALACLDAASMGWVAGEGAEVRDTPSRPRTDIPE